MLEKAAELSIRLDVDGHRADITMLKTAMAVAACAHRQQVSEDDLREAALLVLPHRMRRRPFEETGLDVSVIDDVLGRDNA